MTKIYNVQRDDWDQNMHAVLRDYHTTCKKSTGQTPFRLVYGQEVVMSVEYIVPSLRIVVITEMKYVGVVEVRSLQLVQLEEYYFVTSYHQHVKNERHKY